MLVARHDKAHIPGSSFHQHRLYGDILILGEMSSSRVKEDSCARKGEKKKIVPSSK